MKYPDISNLFQPNKLDRLGVLAVLDNEIYDNATILEWLNLYMLQQAR